MSIEIEFGMGGPTEKEELVKSYLVPNFSFLICKLGIIVFPAHRVLDKIAMHRNIYADVCK